MKTTETPTPTRRRSPIFWVSTAYFGMGLPFVVLNMVAVLMYKGLGVSDAKIAFWTSLIMLPWTLKPLWSPLLEMYRTKKFFGTKNGFRIKHTFQFGKCQQILSGKEHLHFLQASFVYPCIRQVIA